MPLEEIQFFLLTECATKAFETPRAATAFYDLAPLSSPAKALNGPLIDYSDSLLSNELTDCFKALRRVSGLYSSKLDCNEVAKEVRIHRSDEVYLLERRLLVLSNLSSSPSIITSSCIAAIIFIDKHMRGINFIAGIMAKFVKRLHLSLGRVFAETSVPAASVTTKRALFWILCVRSLASMNRPERLFFITKLASIYEMLDLKRWDDAEHILSRFLWPSSWDIESIQLRKDVEKSINPEVL